MAYSIEKLDPTTKYPGQASFTCGHPVIDNFVRKNLSKQVSQNLSVCYVVLDELSNGENVFVGFYTLISAHIAKTSLHAVTTSSLPVNVPVIKLGMIGVATAHQNQKLGSRMLAHAFGKSKEIAQSVGTYGIYLEADPGALNFYQKLGFTFLEPHVPSKPTPAFLKIDQIP